MTTITRKTTPPCITLDPASYLVIPPPECMLTPQFCLKGLSITSQYYFSSFQYHLARTLENNLKRGNADSGSSFLKRALFMVACPHVLGQNNMAARARGRGCPSFLKKQEAGRRGEKGAQGKMWFVHGTKEMPQHLRALAPIFGWFTVACNSSYMESDIILHSLQAPTYSTYTQAYMCTHMYTHIH